MMWYNSHEAFQSNNENLRSLNIANALISKTFILFINDTLLIHTIVSTCTGFKIQKAFQSNNENFHALNIGNAYISMIFILFISDALLIHTVVSTSTGTLHSTKMYVY